MPVNNPTHSGTARLSAQAIADINAAYGNPARPARTAPRITLRQAIAVVKEVRARPQSVGAGSAVMLRKISMLRHRGMVWNERAICQHCRAISNYADYGMAAVYADVDSGSGDSSGEDAAYCRQCLAHQFRWSTVQGRWIGYGETVRCLTNGIPDYCSETWRCTHLYSFCESCQRYTPPSDVNLHLHQDADPERGAMANGIVRGYHHHRSSGWYRPIVSPWTQKRGTFTVPLYLGMELEVEARDSQAAIARDQLGQDYVCFERDGSVPGWEMITQPAGLDTHRERLSKLKVVGKSHDTTTCGLHVHVTRKALSPLTIGKMVKALNSPGFADVILAVARRGPNTYCQRDPFKKITSNVATFAGAQVEMGTRYEALNTTNRDTVEFRIFRGTLKYQTIMSCLEFAYAMCRFCSETSVPEITAGNFVAFLSVPHMLSDTRFLRGQLADKMLYTPKAPSRSKLAPPPTVYVAPPPGEE